MLWCGLVTVPRLLVLLQTAGFTYSTLTYILHGEIGRGRPHQLLIGQSFPDLTFHFQVKLNQRIVLV